MGGKRMHCASDSDICRFLTAPWLLLDNATHQQSTISKRAGVLACDLGSGQQMHRAMTDLV